jgi:hypothetical protein
MEGEEGLGNSADMEGEAGMGRWDSYSFQGSPSYVLACKLKALK